MQTGRQIMHEKIRKLDDDLVAIIKDFLLLGPLSWAKDTMHGFLRNAEKGNLTLPKVTYVKTDYSGKIEALTRYLQNSGSNDHPAIAFLHNTAESYLDAYRILQGVGTKDVTEFSKKLYGSPKDPLPGYTRRNVDVARYFLKVVESYHALSNDPQIYTATAFKKKLHKRISASFNPDTDPISIAVDTQITARVTAGPSYVKIRKGAHFSKNDLDQLFHHEVMTHILTYINGRKQSVLKSLGYNAPRTTATQEGLAVFSEYITLTVEMDRLKRIALRIIALDMAEKGADFIDLFRFYCKHGQNNEESYYSAMRIFRGGQPEGGIVFYKDNVYLRGLIDVSSFFKHAMHQGFIHDIPLLFCGKLTTDDVLMFKPVAEEGMIADPAYMPEWAGNAGQLAAHLAINDLTERFKLKE